MWVARTRRVSPTCSWRLTGWTTPHTTWGQFEEVLYHIDGGDIESATWLQLNEYVLFTMEDAGVEVDVEMDALIQNIRQGSEMMFRTDVWNIDHRFNIRGGEEEIDWVLEQCSK